MANEWEVEITGGEVEKARRNEGEEVGEIKGGKVRN